jgi:hypothetical protein
MPSSDDASQPRSSPAYIPDRFVPHREGNSMNSVYSITEELRTQSNQSPEPNRGMRVS